MAVDTAGERHLVLLIHSLFGPASLKTIPGALAGIALSGLEEFLARAEVSSGQGENREASLFRLFDIARPAGQDYPVAAVTRLLDAEDAREGWWLRADPVHVRADRDRLVMMGNRGLHLSHEEMEQLAGELRPVFEAQGGTLHFSTPQRGYLHLPHDPRINTTSLAEATGMGLRELMPTGEQGRRWHGLLNEVQMSLHASRINEARAARGELTVNSLWFWGSGRLPAAKAGPWTQIWSNEEISRGLAKLSGVSAATVPAGGADWLREADSPGSHLVVLDGMYMAVQWMDIEAWRKQIQVICDEWFEPLLAALKRGVISSVSLEAGNGRTYRLTHRSARRWWRRRRPLSVYM